MFLEQAKRCFAVAAVNRTYDRSIFHYNNIKTLNEPVHFAFSGDRGFEAKSGPGTEFPAGQSGVVMPLINLRTKRALATRVFSACPSRVVPFTRAIRLCGFRSLPHMMPAWRCPGPKLRTTVEVIWVEGGMRSLVLQVLALNVWLPEEI